MVLKRRSLASIFEENYNNELEETLQVSQSQTPWQMQVSQPPAASRQAAAEDWGELLIRLLASAPEDVAQKLAACIDREVLHMALLKRRDDPYLKVALLLLSKK